MSPPFTSPAAAEEAFYRAFAALDATAMRRVWSTNQPVSCIHPGGPFLQGLDAVLESWAEIFAGAEPPRITWECLSSEQAADLAVHVTAENIRSGPPDRERGARVIAINVFRHGPTGWVLTQHHASLPLAQTARAERPTYLH